jgi:hypothetical protein
VIGSSVEGAMPSVEPTPVEIVRGPKGPNFIRRIIDGIPAAIVTAILTTFVLALAAPKIADYVSLFRPTCDNPKGLVEVPAYQIDASGPSEDEEHFSAKVTLDGSVGNVWVPAALPPSRRPAGISKRIAVVDPDRSTLTLTLDSARDVQLVCAVNGLANGYSNYINWGRVRSLKSWTDSDSASPVLSVLKSNDQGSFQEFQDVRVPRGEARRIMIQVVDLYQGQQITSVDPDVCGTRGRIGEGPQNDPIGCNLNANPHGGIAELKVYRSAGSRLATLWPF